MKAQNRGIFERFARLDTWIVGIQYYEGKAEAVNREVVFELDPDNPFDPNAVAVFTTSGMKVGHLPRYDAEYFSPLVMEGAIALKGRAGKAERGDRLSLSLEIFATAKVSPILARDPGDDWRAIYHNLLADIWDRLPAYSSATLREFRERFRPLAHNQPLLPKTQFLYRMLKARIVDLENEERDRLREQLLSAIGAMDFGNPMGWPELAVVPLDVPDGVRKEEPAREPATGASAAVAPTGGQRPDMLRLLPSRCPYPPGAKGMVVLVHGNWHSLAWSESAEHTQVFWYQTILGGIDEALYGTDDDDGADSSSAAVKERILADMQHAECSRTGTEETGGGAMVRIAAGDRSGHALYRDGNLVELNLHTCPPGVVYDEDKKDKPLTITVSAGESRKSRNTR